MDYFIQTLGRGGGRLKSGSGTENELVSRRRKDLCTVEGTTISRKEDE